MKENKVTENKAAVTENKVSRQGRLMRQAIAALTKENLIGQKFKNGEIRKKIVEPAKHWKCPDCFTNTIVELPNCQAEFLEFEEPNHDKVILQLHGGGYIGGMRHAYRSFAGLYNEVGKRYSVLTPDYRVAPEHVFPAALIDALDAYEWLLKNGYREDQIIVAGDSAGGGLALALCLCLKENGRALPCGIVAMSPWTDMTASGSSYQENFENDPLFGGTEDSMIYNREYSAGEDLTNPYLSPLFGEYEGFPPMLIQVGSYEMLLSDSVLVAQKAKEAGVKVRLSIYEGMFHVFQMAPLTLPECKRAWVEIGHFIDEISGGHVHEKPDDPQKKAIRTRQETETTCRLCPRGCGVSREDGERGACGETATIRLARAALHFWEEPCISGTRGSGAVFFTGCQLRCMYCQNQPIAHGAVGKEISMSRLVDIFYELEAQGANNINLVTPDHFIPQVAQAIRVAKQKGFSLPFVYNTSSYVTVEALRQMDGLIDIYLPDLKYLDESHARDYSGAPDYPGVAMAALQEMYRQVGSVRFAEVSGEEEPMLQSGMVVRHLLLPGALDDAKKIVAYLYDTYGDDIYISLMSQYTPGAGVADHPLLRRRVRKKDYDALVDWAIELGVENAFIQEGGAADESFIPAFDYEGVSYE